MPDNKELYFQRCLLKYINRKGPFKETGRVLFVTEASGNEGWKHAHSDVLKTREG